MRKISLVFVLLMVVAGCKENSLTPDQKAEVLASGSWQYAKYVVDGQDETTTYTNVVVSFFAGGGYEENQPSPSVRYRATGTWELKNAATTIVIDELRGASELNIVKLEHHYLTLQGTVPRGDHNVVPAYIVLVR